MSEEEEIDLSQALDPADGMIPEEGYDNYPAISGTFVELDPEYDEWLNAPESKSCSICGELFGDGQSQYHEKGIYSGIRRAFCRECFDTHSEWAIMRKPIIEERAKKTQLWFIFLLIVLLLIILRLIFSLQFPPQ